MKNPSRTTAETVVMRWLGRVGDEPEAQIAQRVTAQGGSLDRARAEIDRYYLRS